MTEPMLTKLFHEPRTHNAWQDRPIPEEMLRELYAAVAMGPTSANCEPGRYVFVKSDEGRAKLAEAASATNGKKILAAPVTVIIAQDEKFYDKLPQLFPHADARSWFTGSPQMAADTAMRNSSLQGAYLILAARALGLDTGPMSGFDAEKVNATFLAGTGWKANFICSLGYGDPAGLFDRLPRLSFDEACRFA